MASNMSRKTLRDDDDDTFSDSELLQIKKIRMNETGIISTLKVNSDFTLSIPITHHFTFDTVKDIISTQCPYWPGHFCLESIGSTIMDGEDNTTCCPTIHFQQHTLSIYDLSGRPYAIVINADETIRSLKEKMEHTFDSSASFLDLIVGGIPCTSGFVYELPALEDGILLQIVVNNIVTTTNKLLDHLPEEGKPQSGTSVVTVSGVGHVQWMATCTIDTCQLVTRTFGPTFLPDSTEVVFRVSRRGERITGCSVSHDGKRVAVQVWSERSEVMQHRVFEFDAAAKRWSKIWKSEAFKWPEYQEFDLLFSGTGDHLYVNDLDDVKIYNITSHSHAMRTPVHEHGIPVTVGRLTRVPLVRDDDKSDMVFDVHTSLYSYRKSSFTFLNIWTGEQVGTIDAGAGLIEFSRDGECAYTFDNIDNVVRQWSMRSFKMIKSSDNIVLSLAPSHNNWIGLLLHLSADEKRIICKDLSDRRFFDLTLVEGVADQ